MDGDKGCGAVGQLYAGGAPTGGEDAPHRGIEVYLHPELLGGALISWVGMTWLTHKDPRYDLPALVYIAVLATAWIPGLSQRIRPWLTAALVAAVGASFASLAFGVGGNGYVQRLALPGAFDKTPLGARYITLYSTQGWLRGAPERNDGNVLSLMRALRRRGVTAVSFCCANPAPRSRHHAPSSLPAAGRFRTAGRSSPTVT